MFCGKPGHLARQDFSCLGDETRKHLHVIKRVVHRVKGPVGFIFVCTHEAGKSRESLARCKSYFNEFFSFTGDNFPGSNTGGPRTTHPLRIKSTRHRERIELCKQTISYSLAHAVVDQGGARRTFV